MKVKHLLILSVNAGDAPDDEASGAVNALAGKYLPRSEVLSVHHVRVELDEGKLTWGREDALKQCSQIAGGSAADYGAYLVFHYGGTYVGNLTVGATFVECAPANPDPAADGASLAGVLFEAAFQRRGLPHLGKVCLLACDAALPDPGQQYLADAFCAALAGRCATATPSVAPPMVAGWDTFVTVAFPTNPSINKTLQMGVPPGSKVAQVAPGTGGKVRAKAAAAGHKWVWVWSSSGYVRKRLAESGWSATVDAQPTSDGKVALITNHN